MEVFDEDFKHFLIVNGVHNEEWVKMNASDVDKATRLVELFSDTVLQKVYEKIQFLEFRSSNSCMVFKFNDDVIELISLNVKKQNTIDLSTPESIHASITGSPKALTLFKSQKSYSGNREFEIHTMLEQGCMNSSEEFWISLEKIL